MVIILINAPHGFIIVHVYHPSENGFYDLPPEYEIYQFKKTNNKKHVPSARSLGLWATVRMPHAQLRIYIVTYTRESRVFSSI